MPKKTLTQLFLLLIIILISAFFFKTYFGNKKNNIISKNIIEKKIDKDLINKKGNVIQSLRYISKDKIGNSYIITSEIGEIDENNPEKILMSGVIATINMHNSSPIKIYADNAIYNNDNYDTKFYSNVIIYYLDNIITSDNLDLLIKKNLVTVTNNIIYKNSNTKLLADKIEINLITKHTKILMNSKLDKINIVSTN